MLITDANQLRRYYNDVGAYDHPDGPPSQPPTVYTCDSGMAVTNPGTNRGWCATARRCWTPRTRSGARRH